MNARRVITDGIEAFNTKQRETGRRELESLEKRMLLLHLEAALAEQMGKIRTELESAASQSDLELQRELDWATDIIIATIRMDNRLSVKLEAEKIQKYAAGFDLHVENDEGQIELELVKRNTKTA